MRRNIFLAMTTLMLLSTLAAQANPWAEVSFPKYFWQSEEYILPISPDNSLPNPWANLGFSRNVWETRSDSPKEIRTEVSKRPLSLINYGRGIGEYKRELISKLALNWQSRYSAVLPTILVTLAKDGKLLEVALYESSDDRKLDNAALLTAMVTNYPPLPESYRVDQVTFKINMSSVQALK